ncbi:MAG: DUF4956 domain-containing protein [Saprospiraceae bacterium]
MQDLFSVFSKIENPTTEMVIFTFLLAFLCSASIALTYYFTTPSSLKTANYIQALMLSSIIATMILQSIGDNVASGLGILGALTIINFRTNFKDPRDIIFMFASLGVGIACGSYVFTIAIIGASTFCLLAILLKYTNFSLGNHFIWMLKIRINSSISVSDVEKILEKYCRRYSLEGFRNNSSDLKIIQDRDYVIIFKSDKEQDLLLNEIQNLGAEVRRFQNQNSEMTEI